MVTIHRHAWACFARFVREFFASEPRWPKRLLFGALVGLLLAISALNVVNSYVGRDFMTALAERRVADFYPLAALYVAVFAASTAVASFQSYAQQRLGLRWRAWLTRRLVGRYLDDRVYLRLRDRAGVDNPDERISEDVRTFTDSALGFVVMLINGLITIIAFAGVTWSISPLLFGVCVGYAVLGSAGTIFLGRRLAGLNGRQLAREADFRAALLHVRANAPVVALTRSEGPLRQRLAGRIEALVENFRTIIGVNLRLSFFTGGYNYLIQIIPILVIGPMYLRGEVEFGVVTQAAMAFAQLVGALSLVVTQFQSISSFAAVVTRVNGLAEAMHEARARSPSEIQTVEEPDRVAFADLTLQPQRGERALVSGLTATVEAGRRLSVVGQNEQAQEALFLTAAGLWREGHGRVERPPLSETRFVPQTPYLVPGTLRDQFRAADPERAADDSRVLAALEAAGLKDLPERVGGLDAERDWKEVLPPGEQQSLALAQIFLARPRFAFLDRVSAALGARGTGDILGRLSRAGIGLVTFAGAGECEGDCDTVLELKPDGSWSVQEPSAAAVHGGRTGGDGAE